MSTVPCHTACGIMRAMNLLLLHPDDQLDDALWQISGRRAEHLRRVRALVPGQRVPAGILNGPIGTAELLSDDGHTQHLRFQGDQVAPPSLPLTLILALPRPKMLKRILIDATSLGIKKIILLNSFKVEKSFWQTPELKQSLLFEKMILGLEQACDTVLPTLALEQRFRPFVEDRLPALSQHSLRLLAHPGEHPSLPAGLAQQVTLAVGPEGGWTPYEVDMLRKAGFACHSFGQRILRVETAVPAIVGRLMKLP